MDNPKAERKYPLRIQNTVHTGEFYGPINPYALALLLRGRYCPGKFPAAVVRFLNPSATGSFFTKGNFVLAGPHNFLEAQLAAQMIAREMWLRTVSVDEEGNVSGVYLRVRKMNVYNIVASSCVGHTLNLRLIADDYKDTVSYEPETFPGLQMEIPYGRIFPRAAVTLRNNKKKDPKHFVVIMFERGACLYTGGINLTSLKLAEEFILKGLQTDHFYNIDGKNVILDEAAGKLTIHGADGPQVYDINDDACVFLHLDHVDQLTGQHQPGVTVRQVHTLDRYKMEKPYRTPPETLASTTGVGGRKAKKKSNKKPVKPPKKPPSILNHILSAKQAKRKLEEVNDEGDNENTTTTSTVLKKQKL